jgi:protein-disulfide isomerase
MTRRHATIFALALGVGLLGAATAGANDEQTIKYFRKKSNIPPTAKVTITGTKDSAAIKGTKEGTLVIGEGPSAKNVPFVSSADGKWVVFGAPEDVTSDPSKAVMAKMSLKGQPFRGPENAKVTIVEYSDFQCPFCQRGYTTLETQVMKEYDGKVKFYFRQYPLPFHPWAEPAAIAAECAKEQKADAYWKLYHAFFDNQKDVNPQNVKDKATEFLKDGGIDMAKWGDCFDNKKTLDKVKAEQQEGAGLGVTGTPSFFINGRNLVGAQPYEQFKAIIDDELASGK